MKSLDPAPRKNHSITSILGDPGLSRRTALPLFLVLFAIANVGVASWRKTLEEERRQNLLQRGAADPDKPGAVVRYDWSVGEDWGRFIRYMPDAEKTPLVTVVGMSQMYAINDGTPTDLTIAERIDDALAPKGVRAFGIAGPNLSNEEAVFILSTLLDDRRTKPDVFVYGVCFDKFRNVDLRPGYQALLHGRPAFAARYREIAERHASTHPAASEKLLGSLAAPEAQKSAEAATVETRLRDAAASVLPVVAARRELNAIVQMELFELRNAVFRIKASSKRPILGARYELNKELLSLLLEVAREEGVRVALYVIPLNPRAETPYVAEQYEDFKRWLEALAHEKGVPFANLEGAVPAEDWGESGGEPDFKHFRAVGHEKTARAVVNAFEPVFLSARERRSARP